MQAAPVGIFEALLGVAAAVCLKGLHIKVA